MIDMLRDSSLVQVEFETGDDIVLRWRMQYGTLNEYVQVKTTEGDAKWSLKDLTMRSEGKVGSSLAEKSLKCDTFDGDVCFRFVSKRDVGSGLKALTVPRNNRRAVTDKIASIVKSVGSKYKTIKSPKERTLTNWASALFWQVEGSIETLTNKNINRIIQHAEVSGEIPSFSQATDIYHDLLRIVADAGNASRVANPDCKAVSRDSAIEWWKRQLDGLRTANRANLKVYRVSTSAFFSRLHHIDEAHILRSMRSYDVEFDEKIWRREELVSHLLDWLPEISLPAKVLAEFSYLDARGLTQRAVQAFESTGSVSDEALLAELFMHAILRHYFDSEPIACKVFHGTGKNSGKTSLLGVDMGADIGGSERSNAKRVANLTINKIYRHTGPAGRLLLIFCIARNTATRSSIFSRTGIVWRRSPGISA